MLSVHSLFLQHLQRDGQAAEDALVAAVNEFYEVIENGALHKRLEQEAVLTLLDQVMLAVDGSGVIQQRVIRTEDTAIRGSRRENGPNQKSPSCVLS